MAEELVKDLVTGFTEALQGIRITPTGRTTARLDRFSGQGGMLLEDWLEEVDLYCEQSQISETISKGQCDQGSFGGAGTLRVTNLSLLNKFRDQTSFTNLIMAHLQTAKLGATEMRWVA